MRIPIRPPVVIRRPEPEPAPPPPPVVEEEVVEEEGSAGFHIRYMLWRAVLWLLVALGIQALASLMPAVVELVYSQTIYYYIARWLTIVNTFFGFSIGEVFIVFLALWFTIWTLWYLRRAFRRESRFFDVIKLLILHLVWTGSVLWVVLLLMWGLNYERLPLVDTWRLETRPARSDELQNIGARIANGINANYLAATGGQSLGGATRSPLSIQDMNQFIEESYQRTSMLAESSQGGFGLPKPLYLSRLATYMDITGTYMPYTGEVAYNQDVPSAQLPFVIAHHKAHQRGYAREDEANFIAYVVCTTSSHPYIRYSGYLHGVTVLDVIERTGLPSSKATVGPGPSFDLDLINRFWVETRSPYLGDIGIRLLNIHLRINRIRTGVANYDEDIPLIIGYYLRYPTAN
ncbi:MAG: DUF3810 domain-containing protein [Acidobacteriota bacterium]|nr:MAG: DUF3810 domain-containing protein [Acidobacteriota bacterium]